MATPCVSYHPSDLDTHRFWKESVNTPAVTTQVPLSFPVKLHSRLAWTGADIQSKEFEWRLDLTTEDLSAIDKALKSFEAKYEDLSSLSSLTFELPASLSQRLRKISDQLYSGFGFKLVHGIDLSRYTAKQSIIVYAGINAHVCPQRGFVDVEGKRVLGHVVDVQAGGIGPTSTAPPYSNGPLSFHTDNCEIMSFYYAETSSKGGRTILSSSWQLYNELAATRPKILHTLSQPWVLDSFKSYSLQPPRHVRFLSKLESERPPVLFRFSRYPVLGWQRKRNQDLPVPTKAQLEALDAVQFIAMKNQLAISAAKGDILFINDMALFHAREGFDSGGDLRRRHLIKMYLRDPDQGWEIPQSLEDDFIARYTRQQSTGSGEEIWSLQHEAGLEELSLDNG